MWTLNLATPLVLFTKKGCPFIVPDLTFITHVGKSRRALPLPKQHLREKISLLIRKLNIELGRNLLGVMFGAFLYMAQRPGH